MKHINFLLFALLFTSITYAQTSIKLEDVSEHTGDSVSVCGLVADMRYFENSKNQPTFLNIGNTYPNQKLTVVIWGSVKTQFKEPIENLKGKQICITGRIILFKERPEIVIENPDQIKVQ
jgi:DNA/RNA endonuclease YhcR with UshA esterase domain